MTPAGRWLVEQDRGDPRSQHARALPSAPARAVWVLEPDRPALVLGSTQRDDVVDRRALEGAGVQLVRRRSGGGAVLLVPGEVTWLDVLVPRDDPLWDDDVGRASHWLGAAWQRALESLGCERLGVHTGPLVRTEWSDLVCFAGVGPGEVLHEGRKVVGVSQRRTREVARFQCAVLRRWDPRALVALLALDDAARAAATSALRDVAAGLPFDGAAIVDALVDALP